MPVPTTNSDVPLAAFIDTGAIAGEIRGMLFIGVLVLVGYLLVKVWQGDVRSAVQRLAIVAVSVIVVGLTYGLLISPEKSKNVTDTVVNVETENTGE